jgi:hypothetical protein
MNIGSIGASGGVSFQPLSSVFANTAGESNSVMGASPDVKTDALSIGGGLGGGDLGSTSTSVNTLSDGTLQYMILNFMTDDGSSKGDSGAMKLGLDMYNAATALQGASGVGAISAFGGGGDMAAAGGGGIAGAASAFGGGITA